MAYRAYLPKLKSDKTPAWRKEVGTVLVARVASGMGTLLALRVWPLVSHPSSGAGSTLKDMWAAQTGLSDHIKGTQS